MGRTEYNFRKLKFTVYMQHLNRKIPKVIIHIYYTFQMLKEIIQSKKIFNPNKDEIGEDHNQNELSKH